MNIEEFYKNTSSDVTEIDSLIYRWECQRELEELDSFLHTAAGSGVILGDQLVGDGLLDSISPELKNAFTKLMGEKIESYNQVRQILYEKIEAGDASVLGLVNKIKGQVGENQFIKELGNDVSVRLASSGNQEAWDVAIDHDWGTQYVQVKMYSDADGVIRHMQEIKDKLANESPILDGDKTVEKIDFAIPEDIKEEVIQKIQGLDINIIPIQMSATEAANVVMEGVNNIGQEALGNFFVELLGVTGAAGVMHGLTTAFLVYKGSKQREEALSDIAQNTTITVGGAIAGLGTELFLQKIAIATGAGPAGVVVFAASMGTRSILKRLMERTDYVTFIESENDALKKLTTTVRDLSFEANTHPAI